MAKNSKGGDFKYRKLVDVFLEIGHENCDTGLTRQDVLSGLKRLHPELAWGNNELAGIGNDLSHHREDAPRATKGTEILFRQLGGGRWTLTDIEWQKREKKRPTTLINVSGALVHEIAPLAMIEGALIPTEHLKRERTGAGLAFKRQLADFRCQVCKFDFEEKYGSAGLRFIEAHHVMPLKEGQRVSKLEDFRAVCSNCHAMIHLGARTRTVEELKEIIECQRQQNRIKPKKILIR